MTYTRVCVCVYIQSLYLYSCRDMFKFVIRIFFNSCLWLFVYKLLFIVDFAVTHTYKHTMIIWYDLGGIVCTVNMKIS